jgi:hypothetical protein
MKQQQKRCEGVRLCFLIKMFMKATLVYDKNRSGTAENGKMLQLTEIEFILVLKNNTEQKIKPLCVLRLKRKNYITTEILLSQHHVLHVKQQHHLHQY